jgi:FixJ family two-component response regulator
MGGMGLQALLAQRPELSIIFVTDHIDVPAIVRAVKAGAVDVLTRPLHAETLLGTIGTALERSRQSMNRQARLEQVRGRYTTLTCREREVMALVVSGWMNKQVSDRLSISIITVKAHRERVMRKMAAGSLAQLVYVANELAITRVEPRAGTRFRVPENRMDTAHAPG